MLKLLMVFVGGGLGSMLRYGFNQLPLKTALSFPWATLLANTVSCIILGFLAGLFLFKMQGQEQLKLLLAVGFCGGFSTFSTYSLETFQMLEKGHWLSAGLYIAGSVVLCLICIFMGYSLSKLLFA